MHDSLSPLWHEQARAWVATPPAERVVAPARDAATVVLLREGPAGLECFLQWRPATMRFAPGVAAFPGGAREDHDRDLRHTAIRELHEETGVLLPGPQALLWWARWITPEFIPIRFDTVFYLARVPPGQEPHAITGETERAAWVSCAAALTDGTDLLQPTRAVLGDLTRHRRWAEVAAARRDRTPILAELDHSTDPPTLVVRS